MPGFSNDENATSKSDVSVICLGGLQVSCCGYSPSLENIRVEAHNIVSPAGIPSDQFSKILSDNLSGIGLL